MFYAGRSTGVFVSTHTNRRRGDMSLDLQYGDSSPELHHRKGPAIQFARKKSVTYTTVEISNENSLEKVRLVQGRSLRIEQQFVLGFERLSLRLQR